MKHSFFNTGADRKESAPFVLPDFLLEKDLLSRGYKYIAGIDEAGRGALAGPLSVAGVIFNADKILTFCDEAHPIRDSKQLSAPGRIKAREYILNLAAAWKQVFISHEHIDKIGINQATHLAVADIIKSLSINPDIVIMDGTFSFKLPVDFLAVKKGDSTSISIAAASIIAKTERDSLMEQLHVKYPRYNFFCHKGYGTVEHRQAITAHGVCEIHRKSYEPAKSLYFSKQDIFSKINKNEDS